jgi:hypothetical protein
MPIVDLEPMSLGTPVDTPREFRVTREPTFTQGLHTYVSEKLGREVATPGAYDVDHGSEAPEPGWGRTFGAAFRQDNTIGAFLSSETIPQTVEDGFNGWDSIKGTKYERHWSSFVDVRNGKAADAVKRQIDREDEDRRLLDAAPWHQSLLAQMAAGVIDWPTLLPGGAFVRSARGGFTIAARAVPEGSISERLATRASNFREGAFSMGRSAANIGAAAAVSTAAQETLLQAINETRTPTESGFQIGASVLLGGLIGTARAL